jgi:hypothetical protein
MTSSGPTDPNTVPVETVQTQTQPAAKDAGDKEEGDEPDSTARAALCDPQPPTPNPQHPTTDPPAPNRQPPVTAQGVFWNGEGEPADVPPQMMMEQGVCRHGFATGSPRVRSGLADCKCGYTLGWEGMGVERGWAPWAPDWEVWSDWEEWEEYSDS